eukprot:4870353-Prymnesium_polylepis.1
MSPVGKFVRRNSKDAISEIAGLACMFETWVETAPNEQFTAVSAAHQSHTRARDRDARARFVHGAQTLAQL